MITRLPVIRQARGPLKPMIVPAVATVLGSATTLLPMVSTAPVMPQFGLLMLLSWRLLRPEMWPAWVALPLGLADDLLTGHFLGTSMALWTITFLVMDWVDHRLVWRDYWMEWVFAAIAIIGIDAGEWWFNQTPGATDTLAAAIPLTVTGILIFPAMVRLTAILDRWRLRR